MPDPDSGRVFGHWNVLRLGSAPEGRCRTRLAANPSRLMCIISRRAGVKRAADRLPLKPKRLTR